MVLVSTAMPCGCIEAIVTDDGYLFACTVGFCRDVWWCECVHPAEQDPGVCDHAEALMVTMLGGSDGMDRW